ncbi:class A beta-lactamase [Ramlibacter tataouinensis]|uniref:Beta-lactamase n=1 Tax=Ramlibacter tataouinensis (strain ATCC BAA-407 / DSM 14655 / LMG 21543 / TTB310) TaxID=365046 RepID=F5Y501_RAMTT|nr:class A beta-lactamase [Ramlibacter tataouinensis]AEG93841.1 Cephalosporinase [Ramlibacter tataouinensis TTB310]
MERRRFGLELAAILAVAAGALPACARTAKAQAGWRDLEATVGGRLGVAVLDTADGRLDGHRLDERFPMCSTFKWLAGALVLHRVDAGQERLDRRIRFGREVLLPHSPVTGEHAGSQEGMTLAALCEATIATSDNAAANLILRSFGGPAALTGYVRGLGDTMTRLDRWEPELNEATPGDPRDTTTPRAMAGALRAALVGEALSPRSREQLGRWMEATVTNGQRLRAGLPAGWRMGSKTGSGARGTTNDVGIFWPPGRPPVIAAVYLTETQAPDGARNAVIAGVARQLTRGG